MVVVNIIKGKILNTAQKIRRAKDCIEGICKKSLCIFRDFPSIVIKITVTWKLMGGCRSAEVHCESIIRWRKE